MDEVWPFMPSPEISESMEWRTELIKSRGFTQRIATRSQPRTRIKHSYTLSRSEVARAALLAQTHANIHVPLWDERSEQGDSMAGATTFSLDNNGRRWTAHLFIQGESGSWEILPITAISAGSISCEPTTMDHAKALIMPAMLSQFQFDVINGPEHYLKAKAEFLSVEPYALDQPSYSWQLFDNFPVMPWRPEKTQRVKAGQAMVEFDSTVGLESRTPKYDYPMYEADINWSAQGWAARRDFRAMLHYLRGRAAQFWLPSWNEDLYIAGPTVGSLLTVYATGYAEHRGQGHIAIIDPDGAIHCYEVISSAPDDVTPEHEVLTLDQAPIPDADMVMICELRTARLAADKIEIATGVGGWSRSRLAVEEEVLV